MTRAFTAATFSDQVTNDRTWRLKEISDLKTAVQKADSSLRQVLLRALVALCYAHWEGYVRFAARKYLEHVALRRFQYKDLDRQFLRNYFLPRLAAISTSKTSIAQRCQLIDDILASSDRRFGHANDDLVNTKSNLSFEVFSEICLVCAIPKAPFEDKELFVDVLLLKRRNSIAHGEETLVAMDDLDELTNKTVELMRLFGNALENRVVLGEYKVR